MGLRLKGVCLDCESIDSHELPSEGIANGAIQVPSDGQPMILCCAQRTTGGYPKIANVILADLFRLGQLRPGQEVQFLEVSFESAWKDNHDLQCLLRSAVHAF